MSIIPPPTQGISTRAATEPPVTPTVEDLYRRSGELVNQVTGLAWNVDEIEAEVIDDHVRSIEQVLNTKADVLSRSALPDLLDSLAAMGLAWRQIAALAGVSVPAIRKWRHDRPITAENRRKVARLCALLEWLTTDQLIDDPVSWLEIPLSDSAPVSRLDLLVEGREDIVLEGLAGRETPPEQLLDRFDPGWRDRYASDFEVFVAEDGQRSIRSKRDAKG